MRRRYHVRWTGADGLAHWIGPWEHKVACTGKPVMGLNQERDYVTCFRCARIARKKGKTLLLDGAP